MVSSLQESAHDPRFKPADYGLQFLAVDLFSQLHPGSFEYALHHLIEHEIDLIEVRGALQERTRRRSSLRPARVAQDRAAFLLAGRCSPSMGRSFLRMPPRPRAASGRTSASAGGPPHSVDVGQAKLVPKVDHRQWRDAKDRLLRRDQQA